MKPTLNEPATILKGALAGKSGTVTEYYSIEKEAVIEIDAYTTIITPVGNIKQES
ncbi:hypothetical protein LJR153_005057 [Paenibacillus sp. LjRoot153]|uniref:hypothetical protein n=1 Tax=Paenibacillus sp. LjRoot153 TaxID=3342270 RepID=UPI003ECDEBFE